MALVVMTLVVVALSAVNIAPAAAAAPVAVAVAVSQTSTPAAIAAQAQVVGSPWDPVAISAPGGRDLKDADGRVVTLHGVNAVYKNAPYELAVDPGQPFDFSAADAAAIAAQGFNLVRLGIIWEGFEPGGTVNDPSVCTPGTPGTPTHDNAEVISAYVARVVRVVDLLGSYHIHTLIDMHQDVYSDVFKGEGAPPWAVCTDGEPVTVLPGRWSRTYASASLNVAEEHFWTNDVIGNLQGSFDDVWRTVATTFRGDAWVVGYDPYNEPFTRQVEPDPATDPATDVAGELECFYTGRLHPGLIPGTDTPLHCPADDPDLGVVPTIEAADPGHLVFVEPDIYGRHKVPAILGPMPFPRLVYNVHLYCGRRNAVTGEPLSASACAAEVPTQLARRDDQRALLASPEQPGGPPLFLSEFGATGDVTVLQADTDTAERLGAGWAYWAWKYYDDPTGSTDEPLATVDGTLLPQIAALGVPYAEAVAGNPLSSAYDPTSRIFTFSYTPDPSIGAPTVINVVGTRYPEGYCATAVGATIESVPGASRLLVGDPGSPSTVAVQVAPGPCPSS
jgi:endoglycosylceramidase